jgi:hypothetical protein
MSKWSSKTEGPEYDADLMILPHGGLCERGDTVSGSTVRSKFGERFVDGELLRTVPP